MYEKCLLQFVFNLSVCSRVKVNLYLYQQHVTLLVKLCKHKNFSLNVYIYVISRSFVSGGILCTIQAHVTIAPLCDWSPEEQV